MVRDLIFGVLFRTVAWSDHWETWVTTWEAFLLTVFLVELSWRFLEKSFLAWSKATGSNGLVGPQRW
jgi:hypothetical protein